MKKKLVNVWNNLDKDDKLEIIEEGIDFMNTSDGSLFLRYYRDNSISASIQKKADNHLSSESVSQTTLFNLFGENYNYVEGDSKKILNWMEQQK